MLISPQQYYYFTGDSIGGTRKEIVRLVEGLLFPAHPPNFLILGKALGDRLLTFPKVNDDIAAIADNTMYSWM
jgi:hypothetical protein